MIKTHSFHIPVMGIGFTLETPLKVSQFGIDSVISMVDDILVEKLRKMYCEKLKLPYEEITDKIDDFRAKRFTSYLNLVNDLARDKFEELKNSTADKREKLKEYFSMLPDGATFKQKFKDFTSDNFDFSEAATWIKNNLSMGSIDVNIMTKLDKENFKNGEELPTEFNDAHAALRGYANSNLASSIILSAGMNPRLYGYIENFNDFFPEKNGYIKKKVVLKVSDYRSALIQGKFFAKKGIWVSEYRVESGLNCGGHAFASDGFLMGPILDEFRLHREALVKDIQDILIPALEAKGKVIPEQPLKLKITAQGGVGTAEEHNFLIDHYGVDSVGWGTPFLLVPEATQVDEKSMDLLIAAQEKDLYLSNISPLGVPFNSLRGNTKDAEKLALIKAGKPGSLCPKKFLISTKEYTKTKICTASRRFQKFAVSELDKEEISQEAYQAKYFKITDKACICVGLGTASLLNNAINTKIEGEGVSICPGPNMAYYSKKRSLKEMIGHIYGRNNVITSQNRPNIFIKEMGLYIDYLKNKIAEASAPLNRREEKYFRAFISNMNDAVDYYHDLFDSFKDVFQEAKESMKTSLINTSRALEGFMEDIEKLVPEKK